MSRLLMIGTLLAASAAFADAPKLQHAPRKLDHEARVYVMDKDAPSADKTVTLARPRSVLKDK